MYKISVVICCHNPEKDYLNRVILSLKNQTLPKSDWELIIVDNRSDISLHYLDLTWHPNSFLVQEEKLGLINARIKGVKQSRHEIIVSVDDDTLLFPDYLENVRNIYNNYPNMGIVGGKSIPEYESAPPRWFDEFKGLIAIRDLGDDIIIESQDDKKLDEYPKSAPLLIAPKRKCMVEYLEHYKSNELSCQLGRKGNNLSSGEDNDINLFIYSKGYELGYFPELKFIHIIPKSRLTISYLNKMAFASNKSWIKVLEIHKINPYKKISRWTCLPRKLKAWFTLEAWKSAPNFIKWRGACGIFESLSELKND